MIILKSKRKGLKGSSLKKNTSSQPKVAKKKATSKKVPPIDFPFSIEKLADVIEISLPIRTVSEANNFDHWKKKLARHNKQKWWVSLAFSRVECQIPCTVKLVRYAPRFLDEDDNLRMAVKYLKDYIAAEITQDFCPGRADGNKLIKWQYDQVKSKSYGVKIIIDHASKGDSLNSFL